MEKKDLDKYIDFMIEKIKQEKKVSNENNENTNFDLEHRRNQRRFEYDTCSGFSSFYLGTTSAI